MQKTETVTVTEVTHHGDYRHERTIELRSIDWASVTEMLNDCPYPYTVTVEKVTALVASLRLGSADLGWTRWTVQASA
jgi:hypothetical protein